MTNVIAVEPADIFRVFHVYEKSFMLCLLQDFNSIEFIKVGEALQAENLEARLSARQIIICSGVISISLHIIKNGIGKWWQIFWNRSNAPVCHFLDDLSLEALFFFS